MSDKTMKKALESCNACDAIDSHVGKNPGGYCRDCDPLLKKKATHTPELLEALKQMLVFSDARGVKMQRTLEESSFADRVSDLIAEVEGQQ